MVVGTFHIVMTSAYINMPLSTDAYTRMPNNHRGIIMFKLQLHVIMLKHELSAISQEVY